MNPSASLNSIDNLQYVGLLLFHHNKLITSLIL